MVTQQAGTVTSSGSGVLLSGTVPPLARCLLPARAERPRPGQQTCARGKPVVLITARRPGRLRGSRPPRAARARPSWRWVTFTHAMWNTRTVEILIWVNAASRESVSTGFAQAANTVDASQPDERAPRTAAARFVSWLAHTRRPWALVIDDLAELSDLEDLCRPARPAGS